MSLEKGEVNRMDYTTSRHEEIQKKLQELPDIFYRYTLDNTIVETPIKKVVYAKHYLIFEYVLPQGNGKLRTTQLSDPDTIKFGVFDGRRKCVFFKEPGKSREAALIFDKEYENQIVKYEAKIRKAILKRRDLAWCIHTREVNVDGTSV